MSRDFEVGRNVTCKESTVSPVQSCTGLIYRFCLLAVYFYRVASSAVKTYISLAWVCMFIRLYISLVSVVLTPLLYSVCIHPVKPFAYVFSMLTFEYFCPCGPRQSPSSLHFPISFTFPFFLSYLHHLFSCFSIPSQSTRIVPLCFQAECCRRRLNLALVFCVGLILYVFFS